MSRDSELQSLEIRSLCSAKTLEGRVSLVLNGKEISQWDVRKAKEISQMLTEAIEAAISDELIVKFLIQKMGLDHDKAIYLLRDFRELRQGSKEVVNPN